MAAITNQTIIDKIKETSISDTSTFLQGQHQTKSTSETILKQLDRLYKKYQQLNKSKSRAKGKENLECFLKKPYEFPETCEPTEEAR